MAFVTGAAIGLFFHRADFLGGYGAFRRRILRLGHIALAALGMLNVIYAISPWPVAGPATATGASIGFTDGGIALPAVWFLPAWRAGVRPPFVYPAVALVIAVLC